MLLFLCALCCAPMTWHWALVQVWRRSAAPGAGGLGSVWRCASVGEMHAEPLHSVAFSPDGSLLAVGGATCASLWDPMHNALVGTLVPGKGPSVTGGLRHVAFLPRSALVVLASQRQLSVRAGRGLGLRGMRARRRVRCCGCSAPFCASARK